ncbi:guanylate kinase [Vibrio breoganii]|uniref:guanylate kinase n=1 Tax=Vibrio breoganii TaxID=553239 RepID=UPI000C859956|nr:guanylate kinase [Vibrio breoganii]PML19617.1 hypothetical protein BCT84_18250 [Vibrio breoganii]
MKTLLLVAGVGGSGKSTFSLVLDRFGFKRAVTSTSRPMRPGEKDGRDYHFVEKSALMAKSTRGELVESAEVRGHLYGMDVQSLTALFAQSDTVYAIVDPQGVRSYQWRYSNDANIRVVTVFIDCPSVLQEERLKSRLGSNPTDERYEEVARSLVNAREVEPMWARMVNANVYCTICDDIRAFHHMLFDIHSVMCGRSDDFVNVATIEPVRWSPTAEMITAVIRELKAEQ